MISLLPFFPSGRFGDWSYSTKGSFCEVSALSEGIQFPWHNSIFLIYNIRSSRGTLFILLKIEHDMPITLATERYYVQYLLKILHNFIRAYKNLHSYIYLCIWNILILCNTTTFKRYLTFNVVLFQVYRNLSYFKTRLLEIYRYNSVSQYVCVIILSKQYNLCIHLLFIVTWCY